MDLHNRLLILLFPNAYGKFQVVCGWFQEILGVSRWFWIVSGGFGWFQVVLDGFRWFAVLVVNIVWLVWLVYRQSFSLKLYHVSKKMLVQKLYNRFQVDKNGFHVGNFLKIVLFQVFNLKVL